MQRLIPLFCILLIFIAFLHAQIVTQNRPIFVTHVVTVPPASRQAGIQTVPNPSPPPSTPSPPPVVWNPSPAPPPVVVPPPAPGVPTPPPPAATPPVASPPPGVAPTPTTGTPPSATSAAPTSTFTINPNGDLVAQCNQFKIECRDNMCQYREYTVDCGNNGTWTCVCGALLNKTGNEQESGVPGEHPGGGWVQVLSWVVGIGMILVVDRLGLGN